MKKIKCDVVVVGAGPGGSMAAKTCAKYGLDTVLVERKEYPSKPNSFTCMVSRRISDYIRIDKRIGVPVYGIVQTAPDGTENSMHEPDGYEISYILNRESFDKELLKIALKENIEYINKTMATGLIREDGKISGIKAKNDKEDIEIRSNIIIGADSAEHHIGRWAGIYKRLDPGGAWVWLDYLLDTSGIDEHTYYQIFGWKDEKGRSRHFSNAFFASGPKGEGKTSLVSAPYHSFGRNKKGEGVDALNYFMKYHPFYKKSKIIKVGGGVAPVSPLNKFTTDNVMLVGDAAHSIMMPYGTGVMTAMESGIFAGERALEAHEVGDFSSEFLSEYENRWNRIYGEKKKIAYYALRIMMLSSDKTWNRFFHLLKENNAKFVDEIFKESPKFTSKIIYQLRKEGLDIDMLSFMSLLKKYYRNLWDTFYE